MPGACGHKSSVSEEAKRGSCLGKALEGATESGWEGRLLPDYLLWGPNLAVSCRWQTSEFVMLFVLLFICHNPNFYESCMSNTKDSCIPLPRLSATFVSFLFSLHTLVYTHTYSCIYVNFSEQYVNGLIGIKLASPFIFPKNKNFPYIATLSYQI